MLWHLAGIFFPESNLSAVHAGDKAGFTAVSQTTSAVLAGLHHSRSTPIDHAAKIIWYVDVLAELAEMFRITAD